MKILVIGAGGKTGRAIVKQAVAAGHEVTVEKPRFLDPPHHFQLTPISY